MIYSGMLIMLVAVIFTRITFAYSVLRLDIDE